MKTIEEIASVHLGKAGDGTIVKPYVTPETIDPSLLVAIPRSLNRVQYGLEAGKLPFVGVDVWNAYEIAYLLENGFPMVGILRLSYSSDSEFIVESKSLKLYLNSFNMHRFNTNTRATSRLIFEDTVRRDLSKLLGVRVTVKLFDTNAKCMLTKMDRIEDEINIADLTFDNHKEDPNLLKVSDVQQLRISSAILRSNCRVTGQPDYGDIFIKIRGEKTVTKESLLRYLISLRAENHFHEEICEMVYKRLWDLLAPESLSVACFYTRRGGIDINPMRASNDMISSFQPDPNDYITRTVRQ